MGRHFAQMFFRKGRTDAPNVLTGTADSETLVGSGDRHDGLAESLSFGQLAIAHEESNTLIRFNDEPWQS